MTSVINVVPNVFLVVSWIFSIVCKKNYLSSSLAFAAEKIAVTGKKLMKKVNLTIRRVVFGKEQRRSREIHGGDDGKGCEDLDVSADHQYSECFCFWVGIVSRKWPGLITTFTL